MFANLMGRFMAFHPPDSNTAGSRLEGGVAHGGVFPSRELADPPANQRCLTASLGPTARPLSGIAAGCSLSDTGQVAGPSGSTSQKAIAIDPVYGSQWSASSIDTTLTAKRGTTLAGSYGFASTGEVFRWHSPIGPNGSTGSVSGCRTAAILAWLHRP